MGLYSIEDIQILWEKSNMKVNKYMPRKSVTCWLVAVFALVVLIIYCHYMMGLHPQLIMIIPIDELSTDMSPNEYQIPSEALLTFLHSKGIKKKFVIGLKGRQIIALKPYSFHSVYFDLITEEANPTNVYVYQYRKRYHPCMSTP